MTTCVSKFRYSPNYEVTIDLEDMWIADVSRVNKSANFGKHVPMTLHTNSHYYAKTGFRGNIKRTLYLHKVVLDACVPNPRPDIFTVGDHVDGNTTNNHPSNLRHVNQHLNSLNQHYDPATQTPPGLLQRKYKTKNGKWFSLWEYKKSSRSLKYFKFDKKTEAIKFANDFNRKFFDAMYQAYLHCPQNGDRELWREYWGKRLISYSHFTKADRPSLLNLEKFVVGDDVYKKLVGFAP